jgi:hypothetical protein
MNTTRVHFPEPLVKGFDLHVPDTEPEAQDPTQIVSVLKNASNGNGTRQPRPSSLRKEQK